MRISDWSSDVCSSDLGGRKTENRGVARPLYAGQIIRDQRIALAEHADDALLLHLPIVKGKGRPQPARIEGGRLKYGPDRPRGRGFRFEVGVARPSTDRKSTRLNSSH